MTLTFDLRTWLLHATHRLYMIDISAQLYWNSFIIQKSYRPDTNTTPYSMFFNTADLVMTFDLWPMDMTLACDTSSLHGWHFCIVILKFIHNSKKLQTGHEHYPPYSMFLNTFDLAVTLTFDLRTWLLHATHRLYMVDISGQLYWNSFIIQKSYRPDTNTTPHIPCF